MGTEEISRKKESPDTALSQLKRERKRHGWSQEELADKIGTTPLTVSRWETGSTLPSPYYRQRLAELFMKTQHELGWSLETNANNKAHTVGPPFAQLLSRYRRRAGFSQGRLAEAGSLSMSYISM